MSWLRQRWFPTAHEEAERLEAEQEQSNLARSRVGEFLSVGYARDFRDWLRSEALRQEPQPGSQETMWYQCGVRDGLRKVDAYLTQLEKFATERN